MNIFLRSLSFLFLMPAQDFEILSVPTLKTALKSERRDLFDYDRQLKHNAAYVYFLKSGKVILMPNSMSDSSMGILFKDKKIFNKYAAIDSFPIKNERITFEELFQPEILQLGESINEVKTYMANLYGLDAEKCQTADILLRAQERVGIQKISNKENMYASLMLGEYIKTAVQGKWILLKQFGTFNPYYIPGILCNEKRIIVLPNVINLFFSGGGISPENFIKMRSIQEPPLKFGSAVFKENYVSYKIISNSNDR